MKEKKLQAIKEDISEFIAEHDYKNRHYLFDKEIIEHFSQFYKKKHIKAVLSEIR